MTNQFAHLTSATINKITPYQAGKPIVELQREFGLDRIIKLASNESPLGTSPKVQRVLQTSLHDLHRYPDSDGYDLKTKLSQKLNCHTQQLTLGSGSSELFQIIIHTFALHQASEVILSQYAFIMYDLIAQAAGLKSIITPARNWGHDLDAMLQAITPNTRLIFIANPNNPTGTFLTDEELIDFLAKIDQNILVVMDEAYFEYVADLHDRVNLIEQFPNLIVTRTFSKAYALASLRIGYSISHPDVANLLNRIRPPFNNTHLSHLAAITALENQTFIAKSIEINTQGKVQLTQGFDKLGLSYIPSHANFISFKCTNRAEQIYTDLLHQGIIIRLLANYGMPDWLRVSIGLSEENSIFLDQLTTCLARDS